MRFPSYLVKNRYGTYYFQLVFPTSIRKIVKRKETRRSLKTTDRRKAVMMAQEFRLIAEQLFPKIEGGQMDWIETKKFLDEVAKKLFEKYQNKVHEIGFDFNDPDSLDYIMPDAKTFLGEAPAGPYGAHYYELDKRDVEAT